MNVRKVLSNIIAKLKKALRQIKQSIKKYPKVWLIGLAVLAIFSGLLLYTQQKDSSNEANSDQDTVQEYIDNGQRLIDIPDDAESFVCDKVSTQTVQDIINEEIKEQLIGYPNTDTEEGSFSTCSYVIKPSQDQKLKNVQITTRKFNEQDEAKKSYDRLTQKNGIDLKIDNNDAYYFEGSNQIIILKDKELSTIVVSQKAVEVKDMQSILEAIADNV